MAHPSMQSWGFKPKADFDFPYFVHSKSEEKGKGEEKGKANEAIWGYIIEDGSK